MNVGIDVNLPRQANGLSILIVEDSDDCAMSEAVLLGLEGHSVERARDGVEALQKIRARRPDVVLLDLGLPKLDGYQVARAIAEMQLPRHPLLIAVSGYGTAEDKRKSREAGIEVHLTKPVEPQVLLAMLRKFRAMVPA